MYITLHVFRLIFVFGEKCDHYLLSVYEIYPFTQPRPTAVDRMTQQAHFIAAILMFFDI